MKYILTVALALALVVQFVDGNQRIINVNALELISDDEDFLTSASGGDGNHICCMHGNCLCNSLDLALAYLTSNVIINITTNVTLSSIIKALNLERVSVIGHNYPTVNCKVTGAINFDFCHNCIIQGITWNGCGTETRPALKLHTSLNITIKNCCFEHSKGQALVLSDISGDVNINHCKFVHNNHYRGHGAAIHYSSSNVTNRHPLFMISNCNFTYNKGRRSVVYIKSNIFDHKYSTIFHYSQFQDNHGASIYAINQNIHLNGKIIFQNNKADNGTGICISNHSAIIFGKNSNVEFIQNSAYDNGGAVFLSTHSSILFHGNCIVRFIANYAIKGAAIYTEAKSSLKFTGTSKVTFTNNGSVIGGSIYVYWRCYITFEGDSSTVFMNNNAYHIGGAIFMSYFSQIYFKGNSITVFNNNSASHGGAIALYTSCHASFGGNSNTFFSNNNAYYNGGAVYFEDYGQILFKENSTATFSNNTAMNGSAFCFFDGNCFMRFVGNSTTIFINNIAESINGGTIFTAELVSIFFGGFSTTTFEINVAYDSKVRTAFIGYTRTITFSHNSTVSFGDKKAAGDATSYFINTQHILVIRHSRIVFNDHVAKWCTNACYQGHTIAHKIIIDKSGTVWCSDKTSFLCLSKRCYCKNLWEFLHGITNNTFVKITDKAISSFGIGFRNLSNITIIGNNNLVVHCFNSEYHRLYFKSCSNITIEGITWIGCEKQVDNPYSDFLYNPKVLSMHDCSDVVIQKSSFYHCAAKIIDLFNLEFVNINNCNFMNNNVAKHSGVINLKYDYIPNITEAVIKNCTFGYNKGVQNLATIIKLYSNSMTYVHSSKFFNNQGSCIQLSGQSKLYINGEVTFENNVAEKGAALDISHGSVVSFDKNSNTKFVSNSVNLYGAAISLNYSTNITFRGNATFTNNVVHSNDINQQLDGTIYSTRNSNVSFEENSITLFINNTADYGAAILSYSHSVIFHKDNSRVMFTNNSAHYCGAVTSGELSSIMYNDNTEVTYDTNAVLLTITTIEEFSASAICTFQKVQIEFSGYSMIKFVNNFGVRSGAAAFSESKAILKDHSVIMFNNNFVNYTSGGAFACYKNSEVTAKGNSYVTFNNNKAGLGGGAIHSYDMCRITFKDNSTIIFNHNAASIGGALLCSETSVTVSGNSTVAFYGNTADNGGVLHFTNSTLTFHKSSTVSFYNNTARQNGGVGYVALNCKIIFTDTTKIEFENNIAEMNAGVLFCTTSNIMFKGNSTMTLTYNRAKLNGGALHFGDSSNVSISQFTNIVFYTNRALDGGAIAVNTHSNIMLTENPVLLFVSNEGKQTGGAGYFSVQSNFIIGGNATVTFDSNKAFYGGAVSFYNNTEVIFKENSTMFFKNNLATKDGGALNVIKDSTIVLKDHTTIQFNNNSAQYGGAAFLDTTAAMINLSDKYCLNFSNNLAGTLGDLLYQDVAEMCNSSCLANRMIGISDEVIATPPNELKFYDPAICIDNDNDTQCNSYHVHDIMLGTKIVIPACVLDYNNYSVESIQFLAQSEMDSSYYISGSQEILISCDTFEGISIVGNQSLSKSTTLLITVSSITALYSDWKQILVNLTIELSPCHPGFWQYPNSEKCQCYNASDIVFCSDSTSTIKRGFWFGSVTGKPTVTFCPISYCNFTCCETTNGYYHLSPVRVNQCRSHRSGAACGSCTDGYTLSFDSAECVNIKSCTAGQTVLVVLLTVTYWIVIILLVFAMMYYRIEIGYLYSIAYYYSIVDILLNENMQASREFYLTVSIISSLSKITPQFLGEFCLTARMSGIDQQFIHYIHPSAVIVILVIIHLFARKFPRISVIISRGIFQIICLLLLLSYTSVASTSVLLMRSLKFHEINKLYTYLSPDIEYFHDRHLAYAIVALLCAVTIVIGLPLLLTLEPFLILINCKIKFTRIKPVLDQFQGCYKDRYRCFASYYMTCRLIIIIISIIDSSNEFVNNYVLIIICGIVSLIHLMVKPYKKEILNTFDGVILNLINFIVVLPLLGDFDSPFIVAATFILVTLPLLIFIAMALYVHKDNFKKIVTYFAPKDTSASTNDVDENEMPMKEYGLIIHDSSREGCTITVFDM